MEKITTSEINDIIKRKLHNSNLFNIDNDTIEKIKERVTSEFHKNKKTKDSNMSESQTDSNKEDDTVIDITPKNTTVTPGELPSAITKEKMELNTDGDISIALKEKVLADKETELSIRETELNRKEEELKYRPQLPIQIENAEPEGLFVFNANDLSLSMEALSNIKMRTMLNPDILKSMNDIWLECAKTKAEIFGVKFEKLGEISFDPFNGTAKYEEHKCEIEDTPQEPILTQTGSEPMVDAVNPVMNVAQPLINGTGVANAINIEQTVKDIVLGILKKHFAELA